LLRRGSTMLGFVGRVVPLKSRVCHDREFALDT